MRPSGSFGSTAQLSFVFNNAPETSLVVWAKLAGYLEPKRLGFFRTYSLNFVTGQKQNETDFRVTSPSRKAWTALVLAAVAFVSSGVARAQVALLAQATQPAQPTLAEPLRSAAVQGPGNASQPVTLIELFKEGLAEQPAIKARRSQATAAEFDLQGGKWGRYPALSGSASATNQDSDSRSLRIEQPLWTGGRITGQIDLAQARLNQAQSTVSQTQQEVMLQLASGYFEVLRFEGRLVAAKQNTQEHQRLLDLIHRRVKSEVSPESDLVLAESRFQLAKTEEIQIARQLATLKHSLAQLVGRPVTAVAPISRPISFRGYKSSEEAIDVALRFSPQVEAARFEADAAAAEIDLAKSRTLPSIVAGYEYTWVDPTVGKSQGVSFVALQYQPGAGLSALTGAKSAEFRRQAAVDSIIAVERQLRAQLQAALSDFSAFNDQLSPTKALLKGTSEVVDSYMRQYQIGRKGWLDVLNAQREKTQALFAVADIESSVELTKVRLMLLTGDLRPDNYLSLHD
jgi:outer membrane protein, adhesin transport system